MKKIEAIIRQEKPRTDKNVAGNAGYHGMNDREVMAL